MFEIFKKRDIKIYSPCDGVTRRLEDSTDEVFSSKAMGDGIYVVPASNKIFSPVSGKVVSIFPTKHAIGIVTKNNLELLIHIGIDTANLNGEYFSCHVEKGQNIDVNDLLVEVDFKAIKDKGYKTDIYLVITNTSEFDLNSQVFDQKIAVGDCLLKATIRR